jgi:hypothetical protein
VKNGHTGEERKPHVAVFSSIQSGKPHINENETSEMQTGVEIIMMIRGLQNVES